MVTEQSIMEDIQSLPDYKERFKAEYYQLKYRYQKLKAMLSSYHEGTLSFTPDNPISLLEMQAGTMSDYLTILEARAVLEKIEL